MEELDRKQAALVQGFRNGAFSGFSFPSQAVSLCFACKDALESGIVALATAAAAAASLEEQLFSIEPALDISVHTFFHG